MIAAHAHTMPKLCADIADSCGRQPGESQEGYAAEQLGLAQAS